MVHDGVQNQCSSKSFLMSAVNGAGKITWSSCSVKEFNYYLSTLGKPGFPPNCLADVPQQNAKRSLDRPKDHKEDPRLPGQRYTADQQCAFFWGRDFRQEVPLGQTKEARFFFVAKFSLFRFENFRKCAQSYGVAMVVPAFLQRIQPWRARGAVEAK